MLGVLLTFSGANIPLGLGMIVFGAIGLYQSIREQWGQIPAEVVREVTAVLGIGAMLTAAIGIILTFAVPAKRALGIGMIISSGVLTAAAVALNWNSLAEALTSPIFAAVALLVGEILVVLGILACFAQRWVLGIGRRSMMRSRSCARSSTQTANGRADTR